MTEMARKNPELNPRVSAYQQIIDMGYDTDDYFITFTSLKKVGINPTSGHDTPNGIYCFPATEIMDMVHGNMKNVPYVNRQPYIHILKKKGKGIVDPLESYSKNDFARDVVKMYKIFSKNKIIKSDSRYDMLIQDLIQAGKDEAKFNTPIAWLWNATKMLSGDSTISSVMGWGGVKSGKIKDWYSDDVVKNFDHKAGKYRIRKKKSERIGQSKTRGGVGYNAQGWNNLLRLLGYNGFADRSGSGLIHSNEPTQAVFLSTRAFTVVDMIENKSYVALGRQTEIDVSVKKLEKKHCTTSIVGHMAKGQINTLNNLASSDIVACHISFNEGRFWISGDGEIDNINLNGDMVRFSDVTIHGGSFFNMKYIVECVIMGGVFNNCEIDDCEVLGGGFDSCDFPNVKVINNSELIFCKRVMNTSLFGCTIKHSKVIDCSFNKTKVISKTFIIGNKSRTVLTDDTTYRECKITNASISNGKFKTCFIEESEIKGGSFKEGQIDYSIIKDGDFKDVKIRLTDIQGGNIE